MKLKKALPPNRNFAQVMNHFLVEKELARQLKVSNRAERTRILATMYDELFAKVPDHPRLTRRNSHKITARANRAKLALLKPFLKKSYTFAEFAPGDCRLSFEVAKFVKKAQGIDISDQRNPVDTVPDNFELIVYDGYRLDQMASNSVDIFFSDQFIEHLHPEDTHLHFELVHRILKPGGKYVFRTPHPTSGPHDVSAYFCDEAECFHLKEWSYTEMNDLLQTIGYSSFLTRWCTKGEGVRLPYTYFNTWERVLDKLPRSVSKKLSRYLIPSLCGVAVK